MIPIKDNLRYLSFAKVSVAIFAINVLMYIGQLMLGSAAELNTTIQYYLPFREGFEIAFTTAQPDLILRSLLSLLAAMFLHGSFMHLFGNMCFFFAFAPAVEARMGSFRFACFYLLSGLVATLTFLVTDMEGYAHILGASGAIGGVLGAYVIYYPKARVECWMPPFTFATTFSVFFLGWYFLEQWMSVASSMTATAGESAGVAFWAHIGGMMFGMAVAASIAMFDVGLLRRKFLAFYALTLALVYGAAMIPAHGWMMVTPIVVATIALTVVAHLRLFGQPLQAWRASIGVSLMTLSMTAVLRLCVEELISTFSHSAGLNQDLHFAAAVVIVMVVSVCVAIAARTLPVVVEPVVIVPVPRKEDRIFAEVVYDSIGAFFSSLSKDIWRGVEYTLSMLAIGTSFARTTVVPALSQWLKLRHHKWAK